ncbi:hypothetical protein C0584_02385 [Candidatus Parcubacteria bacterium]|nr:MAG: hypothetical protein C0584_02385 [Candidatus Parcubacteria bacterium]
MKEIIERTKKNKSDRPIAPLARQIAEEELLKRPFGMKVSDLFEFVRAEILIKADGYIISAPHFGSSIMHQSKALILTARHPFVLCEETRGQFIHHKKNKPLFDGHVEKVLSRIKKVC